MTSITENDLKTKGVSIIESAILADGEAVISVRGVGKYVVLDFKTYNKLRECELAVALLETRNDLANGHFKSDGIVEHMKRVFE